MHKILLKRTVFFGILLVFLILDTTFIRHYFIVATVNGQPIDRFFIDKRLEGQYGSIVKNNSINEILIEQEAKKNNINVSQKEIDTKVSEVKNSILLNHEPFDAWINDQGLTKASFLEGTKVEILAEKLTGNKINVSDEDLKNYLNSNKDLYPPSEISEEQIKIARQQILQEKIRVNVQNLITKLRKKAKVIYFATL